MAGALFHPQQGHEEEDWLQIAIFGRQDWSNRKMFLGFLMGLPFGAAAFCVFLPYALAWRIYLRCTNGRP